MTLMMNFNMFMISCFMFTFYYKHILLTLISLEFMMINLMVWMYIYLNMLLMNIFFLSFFIGVSICEGVMGLSILVYMIRMTGNDYSNSMNLMKW